MTCCLAPAGVRRRPKNLKMLTYSRLSIFERNVRSLPLGGVIKDDWMGGFVLFIYS